MIFASFDLDNTLVNTLDLILLGLAEQGYMVDLPQTEFSFSFIKGYEPPEDFQWDLFFYRLFTERFNEIKPIDDHVYGFLKFIYGEDKEPIRIITARPKGALMHYCIERTLENLFPEVDFSIDVVESGSQKHRYMFGTDIIFEDRRKTAIDMASHGYIVFLRNDVYNSMPRSAATKIGDMGPWQELSPGTIVTFDDYSEVMEYAPMLIRPF